MMGEREVWGLIFVILLTGDGWRDLTSRGDSEVSERTLIVSGKGDHNHAHSLRNQLSRAMSNNRRIFGTPQLKFHKNTKKTKSEICAIGFVCRCVRTFIARICLRRG